MRVSEGLEDDWYESTECERKLGIDWSVDGPPESPCWPPSDEDRAVFEEMSKLLANKLKLHSPDGE